MSWLYCHHASGLGVQHLIVQGAVTESKIHDNIKVKTKMYREPFWNKLSGNFYNWGQIFVMNLEIGREYCRESGEKSKGEAQKWIFDPMLRAIKVAELNQKRKRLTKLNKVVKLTKPKKKTGQEQHE